VALESDGSEALPTEIRIVLAALRHIVLSGEKPTAQEVAEQVGFGGGEPSAPRFTRSVGPRSEALSPTRAYSMPSV